MTDVMKGIRILEVAEHTFVPAASAVLADWGADVIKVEHATRGDAMRGLAKTGVLDLSQGVHVLNEHSNRGKRSIGLDLTKPAGLEVLHALVKTSDVFLTNKLPGVLAKLKIDIDDIRAVNPKIIYVRGTAFGPIGPSFFGPRAFSDLGGRNPGHKTACQEPGQQRHQHDGEQRHRGSEVQRPQGPQIQNHFCPVVDGKNNHRRRQRGYDNPEK